MSIANENQIMSAAIEQHARESFRKGVQWAIDHLNAAVKEAEEAKAFGVVGRIEAIQKILGRDLDEEAAAYIEAAAVRRKKKRA